MSLLMGPDCIAEKSQFFFNYNNYTLMMVRLFEQIEIIANFWLVERYFGVFASFSVLVMCIF